MTSYNHESLILEHHLFHGTILDVLSMQHIVRDHRETHVVNNAIDSGTQEGFKGFLLARNSFQERLGVVPTHDVRSSAAATTTALEPTMLIDDPRRIKCRRGQFDHGMLQNLVTNAVEDRRPGMPVTIKAQEVHGRSILSVHDLDDKEVPGTTF